ncbi:MAG: SDR family NAD(P)-dependent oxidoreductase [Reichenbachiella sp.]
MNTISIFGCGWLGLPLAQQFDKKDFEVKGSTTSQDKYERLSQQGIIPHLIKGVQSIEEHKDFFQSDFLIINIPPRNQPNQPNSHFEMMKKVSEVIPENAKVIFISSTAVYPSLDKTVTESDASYDCNSRGGVGLLAIEDLFRNTKADTTVIRFGGLYGPNRNPAKFIKNKAQLAGKDNPVNMIHLDDCISVIQTIIDQKQWNQTFNACSPNLGTRQTFYEQACKESQLPPPLFSDKTLAFKKVNSDKLMTQLNYQFKH